MDASPGRAAPKPAHLFDRDAGVGGPGLLRRRRSSWCHAGSGERAAAAGQELSPAGAGGRPGGIYFPALELTEAVSLRLFADELIRFTGTPVPPLRDWLDAIPHLLRVTGDRAVPVVIDEFPFLVRASPALPSIVARELGPGGSGAASRARLLLCGSTMSVMGGLLSGRAPLRGGPALSCSSTPSATGMPHASGRSPTPGWPCWCMRWWVAPLPTAGSWCGKTPRGPGRLRRLGDPDRAEPADSAVPGSPLPARRGDRDTRPVAVPFSARRRRRGKQYVRRDRQLHRP